MFSVFFAVIAIGGLVVCLSTRLLTSHDAKNPKPLLRRVGIRPLLAAMCIAALAAAIFSGQVTFILLGLLLPPIMVFTAHVIAPFLMLCTGRWWRVSMLIVSVLSTVFSLYTAHYFHLRETGRLAIVDDDNAYLCEMENSGYETRSHPKLRARGSWYRLAFLVERNWIWRRIAFSHGIETIVRLDILRGDAGSVIESRELPELNGIRLDAPIRIDFPGRQRRSHYPTRGSATTTPEQLDRLFDHLIASRRVAKKQPTPPRANWTTMDFTLKIPIQLLISTGETVWLTHGGRFACKFLVTDGKRKLYLL
jgi:hypothetical protein